MDTPFSLPTPPTLEQRYDEATIALNKAHDSASPELRELMELRVCEGLEALARAFAPEHFKDTDKE